MRNKKGAADWIVPEGATAVYPHVGVKTFDSLVRLNSDSISPPGSTARHRGWFAASATIISTFSPLLNNWFADFATTPGLNPAEVAPLPP